MGIFPVVSQTDVKLALLANKNQGDYIFLILIAGNRHDISDNIFAKIQQLERGQTETHQQCNHKLKL